MLRRPAVLLASSSVLLVASFALLASERGGSREWARGETADEIPAAAVSDSARSIAFSRAAYPASSAEAAVLARDDVWADALSSTTLQGELGAPLLLTPPRSVTPEVLAELKRVGARTVHLVGGPRAFAPGVRQQLGAAGLHVDVVEGGGAIANAVAVAQRLLPDAKTAVLVRGAPGMGADGTRGYVDALTAGAWAASTRLPVLLTDPSRLSHETAAYLAGSRIEKVFLAGGRAALGGSVAAELERLGLQVQRVGGDDRFETAARFAELRAAGSLSPRILLIDGSPERLGVAGVAATVYSLRAAASILLTDADALPPATDRRLRLGALHLVCGPTVTPRACTAAKATVARTLGPGKHLRVGSQRKPEGGDRLAQVRRQRRPVLL